MAVRDVERFVTDEVRASVLVLGAGSLTAMRTRNRGGVGRGLRAERQAATTHASESPVPPSSTGLSGGLLLLTAGELVLVSVRAGLIGHRARGVVARRPLADILPPTLDDTGRLRIGLRDATAWEFDVVKRDRPDAQVMLSALGGRL
jgi:hypothetical protein